MGRTKYSINKYGVLCLILPHHGLAYSNRDHKLIGLHYKIQNWVSCSKCVVWKTDIMKLTINMVTQA
jgi:hypothetical protein